METLKKLKKLIAYVRQLPIAGKLISVIIIMLILILLTFFPSGCAFKFHADSMDNVSMENVIKSDEK